MPHTLRLFVNKKRISTAVYTKDGKLLQVYPEKKFFPSREAWQTSCKTITHPEVEVKSSGTNEQPVHWLPIPTDNWSYKEVSKFTAPPGKYYIGDLCYVLGDQVYDKVYGGQGYESGLYTHADGKHFFLVDNTAYGDGIYLGSDDKEFTVDAGILGITPVCCMEKNDGGGQIYTFTEPVECSFRNGIFNIRSGYTRLKINTQGTEEDGY